MNGAKVLLGFVSVAAALAAGDLPFVSSQQAPACAASQASGKTEKQMRLDDCSCEQARAAAAADRPTYRVGAAPFGHKAGLRVGGSARRGRAVAEADDLYGGLEMPKLGDLRSPEVVGLKERLLRVREAGRQAAERDWQQLVKTLEFEPDNYFASRKIKDRKFLEARERFMALQNSGQWVALPKFDWRERGLDVGPVLSQGACQSCWAFAAMSVYQASWNLEEMRLGRQVFDAYVNVDYTYQRIPSVQQLLNCLSEEQGNCHGGGWHGTAFAFMVDSHVPHIPDRLVWGKGDQMRIEEYTGRKSRCTDILRMSKVKRGGRQVVTLDGPDSRPRLPRGSDRIGTAFDRALAWGYVNEKKPDEQPSVQQLKQALVEHGPVAVPIHGDNCFSVYRGGVFNGHDGGDPTHVMVLIGWDDERQAWLVKNSWGEGWGERGYAWIAYGANSVGRFAAWIQPSPSTEEQ